MLFIKVLNRQRGVQPPRVYDLNSISIDFYLNTSGTCIISMGYGIVYSLRNNRIGDLANFGCYCAIGTFSRTIIKMFIDIRNRLICKSE